MCSFHDRISIMYIQLMCWKHIKTETIRPNPHFTYSPRMPPQVWCWRVEIKTDPEIPPLLSCPYVSPNILSSPHKEQRFQSKFFRSGGQKSDWSWGCFQQTKWACFFPNPYIKKIKWKYFRPEASVYDYLALTVLGNKEWLSSLPTLSF